MSDETVLVGSFMHESNTFRDELTTREDFQRQWEYFGDDVYELRGVNVSVGGVLDFAEDHDVELINTIAASAHPKGPVATDAYEFYTEQILDGIREHRDRIDGVMLPLHGAMVTEELDDGEGPFLSAVRELVGPDVPVSVALDFHGNITDEMVDAADILVAYEEYPHTDSGETGRRAMRFLLDTIDGELDPVMHVERPPVLPFGPLQNTRDGPMAELMTEARRLEDRDDITKINIFAGYHQADIPAMGFSVPVVADGNPAAARDAARDISRTVWEMREDFVGDFPEPPEAIAEAKELAAGLSETDGPVVLADTGDNPGAGTPADGTTVLREMLEQEVTNGGLAIMRDPEVVEECIGAGVGERVTVTIGGKTDDRHGDPIEDVDGYVKTITDGEFVNTGPMGTGIRNHLGRTVLFQCGVEDGINVIVTENRHQPTDTEIWRHVGIQPERLDILVVKSNNHYRADYDPLASRVIPMHTIGLRPADPRTLDFHRIRRPQYPIDQMDDDAYPDW